MTTTLQIHLDCMDQKIRTLKNQFKPGTYALHAGYDYDNSRDISNIFYIREINEDGTYEVTLINRNDRSVRKGSEEVQNYTLNIRELFAHLWIHTPDKNMPEDAVKREIRRLADKERRNILRELIDAEMDYMDDPDYHGNHDTKHILERYQQIISQHDELSIVIALAKEFQRNP